MNAELVRNIAMLDRLIGEVREVDDLSQARDLIVHLRDLLVKAWMHADEIVEMATNLDY